MTQNQKKKKEFFETIAPRVESPVMITTKNQIKKTSFGRYGAWFVILFLVSVGLLSFTASKYQTAKEELNVLRGQNQERFEATAGQGLLDRISNLIVVPEAEDPSIVTIEDAEGLRGLHYAYTDIKNGDKLVTFDEVQIVYDPIADVIVSVRPLSSPVSAVSQDAEAVEFRKPQEPISLDVRNGAGAAGLAGRVAEALGSEDSYTVASIGNAVKTNHSKTIIVNFSEKDVSNLEQRFNATAITSLPSGEPGSQAEVVLILGRDSI